MIVQVYMNTNPDNFFGYQVDHALATDDDLVLNVKHLDHAYSVANRMRSDLDGRFWPDDVRSVSVGDVFKINDTEWWTVDRFGFSEIDAPTKIVPLAGNFNVTSR